MADLVSKIESRFETYGIESTDPTTPEYFCGVLKIGIAEFGFNVREIAVTCGMSPGTVERWAAGKSSPVYFSRIKILEELCFMY